MPKNQKIILYDETCLKSFISLHIAYSQNYFFILRLRLNSSFIDSPLLKVGKTLFKIKMHQISKFRTFSEKMLIINIISHNPVKKW
jgi:hypothetical protein